MPSEVGRCEAGPSPQCFLQGDPFERMASPAAKLGEGEQGQDWRSHAAPVLLGKNAHLCGLGVVTG